jgi:hypothetical protein
MFRGRLRQIVMVVYLLVGVLIASQNGYFVDLTSIRFILSAVLAIVLWPLVLFGVNLTIG